jgi:hypothetical protein
MGISALLQPFTAAQIANRDKEERNRHQRENQIRHKLSSSNLLDPRAQN